MSVSKEQLSWLMAEEQKYKNNNDVLRYNKEAPKGSILTTYSSRNGQVKLHLLLHKAYIENNDLASGYERLYNENKGLGIQVMDVKSAFKKAYPRGFVYNYSKEDDSCTLYSLDYNTAVMAGRKQFSCSKALLDQISSVVPLYRSKDEAIKKLSKGSKPNFHAIKKFYGKKNRIIGYEITDGVQVRQIDVNSLKVAISSGKVVFDNLTLTSDGRLVMKS